MQATEKDALVLANPCVGMNTVKKQDQKHCEQLKHMFTYPADF